MCIAMQKTNNTQSKYSIDFEKKLLDTISRIQNGTVKWHTYEDVFRSKLITRPMERSDKTGLHKKERLLS